MIHNGSLVAFVSPLSAVCETSSLPSYMIPSSIHYMDHLPLTLNSKVDKNKLLETLQTREKSSTSTAVASTSLARFISVVGLAVGRSVEPDERLHLNSILAMRLLYMLRRDLDLELELAVMFQDRSVRDLYQLAVPKSSSQQDVRKMLVKHEPKSEYPLTRNQQRLLALHLMSPSSSYNIPIVQRFFKTSVSKLKAAVLSVIQRHSALRLVFNAMNISQSISSRLPAVREEVMSESLVDEMLGATFDLTQSCLRVAVAAEQPGQAVLVLVLHHIVCDGLSVVTLLQDIYRLLDGKPLSDLSFEFVDYALCEPEILSKSMVTSLVRQ